MIRVSGLSLPLEGDLEHLRRKAAKILGISAGEIRSLSLARQSIDARRKSEVHYVCTVDLTVDGEEAGLVRRAGGRNVSLFQPQPYQFPPVGPAPALPP